MVWKYVSPKNKINFLSLDYNIIKQQHIDYYATCSEFLLTKHINCCLYFLRQIPRQIEKEVNMLENAKKAVGSLTELGIALLALAIIASLLVGPSNMAFLGDVVSNITALVAALGNAGLVGLISLGVILWLFQR